MLHFPGPMTSAERQRRFVAAHPGYYARIQARKRALAKAAGERYWAERAAQERAERGELPPEPTGPIPDAPTGC
ncbi:MAG: hypothetical protein QM770_14660 [Tepidisphaeraceae bacterium]